MAAIAPNGLWALDSVDSPAVDLSAYTAAAFARNLELEGDAPAEVDGERADREEAGAAGELPFRGLRYALADVDAGRIRASVGECAFREGVRAIDEALRQDRGFGIDDILAVLNTAESFPVPGEPIALTQRVRRDELVADVSSWAGLSDTAVAGAVDMLTLTRDALRDDGLRYWEVRRRAARLVTCPLLAVPGTSDIVVLPRAANHAKRVLLRYLVDGRLPSPNRGAVQAALDRLRRLSTRELELEADSVARELGLATRRNLTPPKAARAGLPELPGEIDVVAADARRRRLWIVEAKHVYSVFDPTDAVADVVKFYGLEATLLKSGEGLYHLSSSSRASHVSRLLAKAKWAELHLDGLLEVLGVSPGDTNWVVQPLMVTRGPTVAAFVSEPSVPYVAVDHLNDALRATQLPYPGWYAAVATSPER